MLALLIFLATLVLVIWQPRGLGIGWGDVPVVWHIKGIASVVI